MDAATGSDDVTELFEEANTIISDICDDHFSAADTYILDQSLKETLKEDVKKECQELTEYIQASKRFKLEINSRSKDRVVSFGERLSCMFMAYALKDQVCVHQPTSHLVTVANALKNVDAEYVDLSDSLHCIPGQHLDASFYVNAAATFRARILACGDRVPVVTGFFGNVPGSLMDGDVGRGYTDLCAALIAVGMKADELQIWKEVDGIFTADPSKVPTARLLASITPSEAAELTFYGSEVIHHLTMDQVIKADPPIPVRIKNVKNPRGDGTIVIPNPVLAAGQELRRSRPSEINLAQKTPKRPTAVTSKPKITVINVHSNKRSIAHGFVAKVFAILDRYGISVDLISTSEVHISMAIHIQNPDMETMDKATKDLSECGDVSVIRGMAILSLVGADMKNMIGVAGKMFTTLGDHNVNIEMISQGEFDHH